MENLIKALLKVQEEIRAVPKDTQGYGYKYMNLDDLMNMLRPLLTKNNLVLVQELVMPPNEYPFHVCLKTTLYHTSGEKLESSALIPTPGIKGNVNEAQAFGMGVTYGRRYAIAPLFGIVSDEDTDAATPEPKSKPKAKAAPAQNPGPLADDEQVIYEAPMAEFFIKVIALIDRYDNAIAAQNALKKLGYTGLKKTPMERVEQYRALRDHAKKQDAEAEE